ncbi:uncharacterized protein [Ambystoma mexicanum]|uniref:uncharacterized protein n=1 Tax=Ambystoma mexicanum TaxID=8296 RepID=UPI0037E79FAE
MWATLGRCWKNEHRLFAKLEKCSFHVTEVEFLGFMLTPRGVHMDTRKVEATLRWPSPTSIIGVQSVLGFANFYRCFIPQLSQIVHPITSLLKKNKKFLLSAEAELAFQELKQAFTSAPILRHPRPDLPYVVETDASSIAMGAVFRKRTLRRDSFIL